MSTLERLKAAQEKRRHSMTLGEETIDLVPLTALQAQPIIKQFSDVAGLTADDPRLLDLYIELIAHCACDHGTNERLFNSEEGREVLRELPMTELFQLGAAAAEASGLGGPADAKKN